MAQTPPGDPLAGLFGLLVGHQWPGLAAVTATGSASATRAATAASHDDYADALLSIRGLALPIQRGVTAEDIDASFGAGETHIREIAARNRTKAGAYDSARRSASQLRRELQDIARKGEADIREIVRSAAPAEQKISAIVDVVADCQGLANGKAAQQAGNIMEAIQHVLDAQGSLVPARQLVRQGGVDLSTAFQSRSPDEIRRQVTSLLENPAPAPATAVQGAVGEKPSVSPGSATGISGAGGSGPPVPATGAGIPATDTPPRVPATPPDLAADPNTGQRAGAPTAGHLAGPRGAFPFPDAPAPPGMTRVPGTEQAVAPAPPEPAPLPTADAAQPVIAATAAPLTPAPVVSAPVANNAAAPSAIAPRPLLAYGADIKPQALGAPPVTPGAPASPTGIPGPAGHYPVERRTTPVASGIAVSVAGPARRAVAAPATRAAAIGRLRRLLSAVARQQPALRWAIGDLEDGTTVLVTDLACGWIPPGVRIPAGVRLLAPAARPGELAALLAGSVLTAVYEPGRVPPAVDGETPVSARARETVPVDDLAWELSRATKWREGLPRLAHTLAKAAASGTGVLDSETALLHRYLDATGCAVLATYPTALDRDQISDWQLLATVDALVHERITLANYHFAWFLALTRAERR